MLVACIVKSCCVKKFVIKQGYTVFDVAGASRTLRYSELEGNQVVFCAR